MIKPRDSQAKTVEWKQTTPIELRPHVTPPKTPGPHSPPSKAKSSSGNLPPLVSGADSPPVLPSPTQPMADPLAGLAPLPPDLLADLSRRSGGSPFGEGFVARRVRPRPIIDDSRRRGLDWERYPSLEAFSDTALEVVSGPAEAFSKMRRSGGIGNPLGFLTVAYVLGTLLMLIEAFLLLGGLLLLAQAGFIDLGRDVQIPWETFFLVFGGAALLLIPVAVMSASIGGFLAAVLVHLSLMVCGAAHAGFEATYRVLAFANGSVYMLLPIPIVGPLFALVMQPLALIYGLMLAHETEGWRVILAVLLPPVLAAFSLGLLFLVLAPSVTVVLPAGS